MEAQALEFATSMAIEKVFALTKQIEPGFVVTLSERSLKPNYSALLNKAEADSIGGIVDNQVRCHLVAGKRGEVF